MSFASTLAQVVVEKKHAEQKRSVLAAKWKDHASDLVDKVVEVFKQRCRVEAEQQKTEITVSFEVLTRSIEGFPRRVLRDATYLVEEWGEGVSAESWYYAVKGTANAFSRDHTVLYAEVLEDMMPTFVERLRLLEFDACKREAGTWKVFASWSSPKRAASSFVLSLADIVADQKREERRRRRTAEKWTRREEDLLDKAIEFFKDRCVQEAQKQKTEASISFDLITREIPEFPKRVLRDANFYVEECSDLESWHYASRGSFKEFVPGQPVLFSELLDGMMPRFVEKLEALGFACCRRVPGTWKVSASWQAPKEVEEKQEMRSKRRRVSRERDSAVYGA